MTLGDGFIRQYLISLCIIALQDFEGEGFLDLCIKLKSLSTESHKYQAKKDRREQKSCFRDVLSTVELGDYAKERLKVSITISLMSVLA